VYSLRWIPDEIDRAKLRTTLMYVFKPRIRAGIEWNPLADDASPLLNLHLVEESARKPAVVFGVSSDRIGTPEGKSYYLTVAKDLRRETGLRIAPYVGVAHGTYESKTRAIGGINVDFGRGVTILGIFDGVHGHAVASVQRGRHGFSAVFVRFGRRVGLAYNVAF
jgi:hypothetical protein